MSEVYVSIPGPLDHTDPTVAVYGPRIRVTSNDRAAAVELPGILGNEQALASTSTAYVDGGSPLGAPGVVGYLDFTGLIPDGAPSVYVMDLTTPGGVVRVPVSSWQSTLQVGRENYTQAVIPGAEKWAAVIDVATAFVIYRVIIIGGEFFEYAMASSVIDLAQDDTGARRRTYTISGHTPGYIADPDPSPVYDRTLTGIRSIFEGPGGVRVRCDIDFVLRPGQRAFAEATEIIVSYINYYVNARGAYMDVGERV